MSAPPLICPPTSRGKFPSLKIPKASSSVSAVGFGSRNTPLIPLDAEGPSNYHGRHGKSEYEITWSQSNFNSSSDLFSSEVLTVVGDKSADHSGSSRSLMSSVRSTSHFSTLEYQSNNDNKSTKLPLNIVKSSASSHPALSIPGTSYTSYTSQVSNSSNTHTTNVSKASPFPFPVRSSPSFGTLNINTQFSKKAPTNSISYTIKPPTSKVDSDVIMGGTLESSSGDSNSQRNSVAFISTEKSPNIPSPIPHHEWTGNQRTQISSNYEKYKNLDMEDLDEEGWQEVAKAGAIQEIGRLGEGAGGSVTRCKLRSGSKVFALKAISSNPNPELQKQILRELQFNRTCNSPHIVKYYGTFLNEESANIFIAMEYCGGGSLEAIYKRVKARGGRIGEKVLGKIAEGVLSGLSYLHERRIIHRDIKPQNILLDIKGQVKLCDFGVSGEVVDSLATTFTGTSYYMAPERIQGQPYTVTSDVWSLGLTVMEVAQHRFPFLPENHEPLMPIELLTVIVNMPAPELADEPSEGIKWSKSFRHFLLCCLEKEPSKRASPRQMLTHPWISGQHNKAVKMDKFVKECWS